MQQYIIYLGPEAAACLPSWRKTKGPNVAGTKGAGGVLVSDEVRE